MTTWFVDKQRKEIAEKALESWENNLIGGPIHLHIADDGSLLDWKFKSSKWITTYSRQERRGIGASLNVGFKQAFEFSPVVLYMVDDWILEEPLDIKPWVQLLEERNDVGIVRLGPPHPFLRGEIMPYTTNWQGWALRLERYGLSVGHRPELFHRRYIDAYGWFDEDVNAQECERLASVRYAEMPGPDIVYALPHPWYHYHLDVLPSTSHIDPKDN